MPVDASSVLQGIVIAFGGVSAAVVLALVAYWLVGEQQRVPPDPRAAGTANGRRNSDSDHER